MDDRTIADDEIDLYELWQTIWEGRWLIAVIAGVSTLGAVAYALLADEQFKAQVSVMPADAKSTGGGLSSALGNLGGLAALAGVTIGSGNTQEPLAVLKSRDFSRAFIEENNLLPEFFPGGKTPDGGPLDWRDGVEFFETQVRTVTEDKKTGVITVGIVWTDREKAARWANLLVRRLNRQMRQRALTESERNVAYLNKEIAATNVVSLQQALGRVLEMEMQKLLLARGNEEFAFKIIDEASPPKGRYSPKRTLITLVAFLAGVFSGILIVFIRKTIQSARRERTQRV